MPARSKDALALVGWLALSFAAALVGSQFRPGAWYATLAKPAWTPPGALFAPVWTLLYALMGISAWLVWRRIGFRGATAALSLFVAQLSLNALWPYLFFGLHRPDIAFAEILVLWMAILATLLAFWRITPPAGALMLPYLLWVSFAAALNLALWRLNP